MVQLVRRVITRLRSDGLWRTLGRAWDRAVISWQEWRLGIRSAGYITTSELAIEAAGRNDYEPTAYADIRRSLENLEIAPDRDVLLDYGAGMGRMMIAAARYPFRKIIGIELTPRLSAIARENIARRRGRFPCRELELVTADACDYAVPPEVTVIYIFNSFGGEVLAKVLQRIRQSFEAAPRKVTLVFCAPANVIGDPLGHCDWLARRRAIPGSRDKTVYFYETK